MNSTPIVLFTYARVEHTLLTIQALLRNPKISDHDLIIFSDAAKTPDKQAAVNDVRNYLSTVTGFRSVTIHKRVKNLGLANSIINGVTQILAEYERIIVLEDDIVTSPHFLGYMNDALERFRNDERVASIHGYVYPVQQFLPEAFFLAGADCWGWATWRRGWQLFNPDGKALLDELKHRDLIKSFNMNGTFPFSEMLENQVKGLNDSWAIRWHASAFLAGKLTLYPGRSLVLNIGNDRSGTHCVAITDFDGQLSETPINLDHVAVEISDDASKAIEIFFDRLNLNRQKRIISFCTIFIPSYLKYIVKLALPTTLLSYFSALLQRNNGK